MLQHVQAQRLMSQRPQSGGEIYLGCYEGSIPGHALCHTSRGSRHLIALKVFDPPHTAPDNLNLPWDLCNAQLTMLHRIAHFAAEQQLILKRSSPLSAIVCVLGVTSIKGRPTFIMERALTDASMQRIFKINDMLCPNPGWRGWPAAAEWWECCHDNSTRCPSSVPLWALRIIAHDIAKALTILHKAQVCSEFMYFPHILEVLPPPAGHVWIVVTTCC